MGLSLCLGWAPGCGALEAEAVAVPPAKGADFVGQGIVGGTDMPLYFIENRGQLPSPIGYYLAGKTTSLYFTPHGVALVQLGPEPMGVTKAAYAPSRQGESRRRWGLALDFVAVGAGIVPLGAAPTPARVGIFKGKDNPVSARTYGAITYPDLWPGVDLIYNGEGGVLESTYVVRPGADPARIRLAWRGARKVALNATGGLVVETPLGPIEVSPPVAYQQDQGIRRPVAVGFTLERSGPDRWEYGFRLGAYDAAKNLLIDPNIALYTGFIGGAGSDRGRGIAVDRDGNAYVVGSTYSTPLEFPVAVGPGLVQQGELDAFVAKVNAQGTRLLYAGYIGGSGDDEAWDVAVDGSGSAYITGVTASTDFPLEPATGAGYGGRGDAFVVKVAADGGGLVYSRFIGGAGEDAGHGIAVDQDGRAYVTGLSGSDQASFPLRAGPDLTYNGNGDAFVAKLDAAGQVLYAGYIGGDGADLGNDIALDDAGRAYVTGRTLSPQGSFPLRVGPGLFHRGSADGFVARVAADGGGLDYAGYLGGAQWDELQGIDVDGSGAAYVTGWTLSSDASLPLLGGAESNFVAGPTAYVAKVAADGAGLDYAGYVHSATPGYAFGLAVDGGGRAHVVGTSATSTQQSAFVTILGMAGAVEETSTLSGSGHVGGYDIALDRFGQSYITGQSGDGLGAVLGPDLSFNGGRDAFVAKLAPPCSLDLDADGSVDVPHDALLLVRFELGLRGSALTQLALGDDAERTLAADIEAYIARCRPVFDVDDNLRSNALTDGLLVLRQRLDPSGTAWVEGAIGAHAQRTQAGLIDAYIQSLLP